MYVPPGRSMSEYICVYIQTHTKAQLLQGPKAEPFGPSFGFFGRRRKVVSRSEFHLFRLMFVQDAICSGYEYRS